MPSMVIAEADQDSGNGAMPSEREPTGMGGYNEELVRAGVMPAGEGLHPSSRGSRVRHDADGKGTVVGAARPPGPRS